MSTRAHVAWPYEEAPRRAPAAPGKRRKHAGRLKVALLAGAALVGIPGLCTALHYGVTALAGASVDVGAFYRALAWAALAVLVLRRPRFFYRLARGAWRAAAELVREDRIMRVIAALMVHLLALSLWWACCHALGPETLLYYPLALLAAQVAAPLVYGLLVLGPGLIGEPVEDRRVDRAAGGSPPRGGRPGPGGAK